MCKKLNKVKHKQEKLYKTLFKKNQYNMNNDGLVQEFKIIY